MIEYYEAEVIFKKLVEIQFVFREEKNFVFTLKMLILLISNRLRFKLVSILKAKTTISSSSF